MTSSVTIAAASLPDDVQARLDALGPTRGGRDVIFLPLTVRRGEARYLPADAFSVADARAVGLNADYLVPAPERRYLSEYSTVAALLEFALDVSSELTAASLAALGAYIWRRIRRHADEAGEDPDVVLFKATVSREAVVGETVTRETFVFEGPAADVTAAVQEHLSLPPSVTPDDQDADGTVSPPNAEPA